MSRSKAMLLASVTFIAAGVGFSNPLPGQDDDAPSVSHAAGGAAAPSEADRAATLRVELAQTKLEVRQLRTRLEEIQRFLAEQDLDQTLEAWREERAQLAEERRRLRQERVRLREERQDLRRETMLLAEARRQAAEEATHQAERAAAPRWDAQYQMGVIDKDQQVIYVRTHHGSTLVEMHPGIDRKNVKVRGTFENRSEAPWRYTFEIRVARAERDPKTKRRQVIGSWKYQTPLLGPNDLHPWEVTVPVTEVRWIDVVQIGNVAADRPAPQPTPYPEPDASDSPTSAGGTARTEDATNPAR